MELRRYASVITPVIDLPVLSWLANAGVPVKTLQDFARHSDVRLTMNLYARTLQGKLAEAAEHLPDRRKPVGEALRATGTCDPGPDRAESTALRTALNVAGNSVHEHLNERQRPELNGRADADNSQPTEAPRNHTEIGLNEHAGTCVEMHASAREWMGIEPTRDRVNDPSTALKAAGPTRRPDTPRQSPHQGITLTTTSNGVMFSASCRALCQESSTPAPHQFTSSRCSRRKSSPRAWFWRTCGMDARQIAELGPR